MNEVTVQLIMAGAFPVLRVPRSWPGWQTGLE